MTLSSKIDALIAKSTPDDEGWAMSHEVSPGVVVSASRTTLVDKRDGTIWRDTVVDGVATATERAAGPGAWVEDVRAPVVVSVEPEVLAEEEEWQE